MSTRALCAAPGVQASAIYRILGDMQGLLDAVASHGFETNLRRRDVGLVCRGVLVVSGCRDR